MPHWRTTTQIYVANKDGFVEAGWVNDSVKQRIFTMVSRLDLPSAYLSLTRVFCPRKIYVLVSCISVSSILSDVIYKLLYLVSLSRVYCLMLSVLFCRIRSSEDAIQLTCGRSLILPGCPSAAGILLGRASGVYLHQCYRESRQIT